MDYVSKIWQVKLQITVPAFVLLVLFFLLFLLVTYTTLQFKVSKSQMFLEKNDQKYSLNIPRPPSSIPKSLLETNQTEGEDVATVSPPNESYDEYSISRRPSYRMDEEILQYRSSEYSSRGRIWSSRPSWQLSLAPRLQNRYKNHHIDHVATILKRYDVDPIRGFLPDQDPLQRLPYTRYHIWEDLADDLPKLLCARLGQARDPLRQLPVLSIDKLATDRELRRAHLLLCLFAHAFVWGGPEPLDFIPEGIARPLMQVSEKLGIPPVLGHPSIVLYNWRRFDLQGDICMENLSTLNNFFDGRDENWFYLITVEIEAKGAAAIVPMMLAIDAIVRYKEETKNRENESKNSSKTTEDIRLAITPTEEKDSNQIDKNIGYLSPDEELSGELNEIRLASYVTIQLQKIAAAIKHMCNSLSAMREGCHPFIFYHRVRPFLSGWKHNPTLPNGIVYQGVGNTRYQYYGGSAAQSSLIPFLDIGLGISHESTRSRDFLLAMRDYMVKPHREFLTYLETVACIREYVIDALNQKGIPHAKLNESVGTSVDSDMPSFPSYKYFIGLRDAYDACVEGIKDFRTGHISLVADYIMVQQKKNTGNKKTLEESAGGKGTGGTDLMKFLKPIRDNCEDSILNRPVDTIHEETKIETENVIYIKDHGDFEDIDLYRGGHSFDDGSNNIWRDGAY